MHACLLRFMRTATRYDELCRFVVLPPRKGTKVWAFVLLSSVSVDDGFPDDGALTMRRRSATQFLACTRSAGTDYTLLLQAY